MTNTKQLTLSSGAKLGIVLGAIIMGFLFARFRRFELARPTLFSIVVIMFAVAMKWELRGRVWFWATMLIASALHILIILCVPWTTRWIPALVMTPIAAADVAGTLVVIKLLEKQFGKVAREN